MSSGWWLCEQIDPRLKRPAADVASASIPESSGSHGKTHKKRARPRQGEEGINPNLDIAASPLMLAVGAKMVRMRVDHAGVLELSWNLENFIFSCDSEKKLEGLFYYSTVQARRGSSTLLGP